VNQLSTHLRKNYEVTKRQIHTSIASNVIWSSLSSLYPGKDFRQAITEFVIIRATLEITGYVVLKKDKYLNNNIWDSYITSGISVYVRLNMEWAKQLLHEILQLVVFQVYRYNLWSVQ